MIFQTFFFISDSPSLLEKKYFGSAYVCKIHKDFEKRR